MAPLTLAGGSGADPLLAVFADPDQAARLPDRSTLNPEDMARRLAADAGPGRPVRRGLLERTRDNHRLLVQVHKEFSAAAAAGEVPPLDAEWLLDNFHVIDEVFEEVLTDLPRGYYHELPAQALGPYAGLPRTFTLALGLLALTDGAFDEPGLRRYVRAYQEIRPLTLGEVWAVPIMLRVGLLETLARLARQMQTTRLDRKRAEADVRVSVAGQASFADPATDAYVVGVLHALRDLHEVRPDLDERVRTWMARRDTTAGEILRRDSQRQAANQVSIGNAVTSLRLLAALDWPAFVEDVSEVEKILRDEPTGNHARQTFATRDACRGAVERLARGAKVAERDVALRAVALAAAHPDDPHAAHAAHYLIGDGEVDLARSLGYRPKVGEFVRRWMVRHPNATYFGLLTAFTVALVGGVVALSGGWPLAVALAALLPAAEVAVGLLNFVLCRLLPPRRLPRMDFREGVPEEAATFVVIPGMITKPEGARGLLDRLELHYLANPDPNLTFALLTDFADAPSETMPADAACIEAAMQGVAALNARHPRDGTPRFFVLHRRRLFNPSEGCWMGWERKRGKLHEFNRLIRGADDTTYEFRSPGELPRTPFVLTLDSDTVLPRDAARALIGTLAHPLNRARLSADGRRVVSGYSILQPRVSFLYASGSRSLFARLFAYSAGIDPYSTAVSDTYMDLFGRANFTGKGLYDVDAFEATAGKALPENSILSHDLIESNFARAGLVSTVEVFDDFPSRYTAYSRREHRWARGDWQLLPWLGASVPVPRGGDPAREGEAPAEPALHDPAREGEAPAEPALHEPSPSRRTAADVPGGSAGASPSRRTRPLAFAANPLPALERWKVIDNLRRSLTPAALVLMLALGWTVLPGGPWLWSLLALLVLAAPLALHAVGSVLSVPAVGVPQAWVNSRAGFVSTGGQALLAATFLSHQAITLLDALFRTLARVFVTRRRMLEWETAAATEARLGGHFTTFLRQMLYGVVFAGLMAALVAWVAPHALPAAAVFLVPWALSPLIAWAVSLPTPARRVEFSDDERKAARRLACKTWGFFEAFVGDADHWLPPDNYQEGPVRAVAHRTSPTNIGLLLTSTLAAHDLGYITAVELADRVGRTLDTLDRLERFRGHFLNWYDTLTLQPLAPAYVSSVDSGNLVGCLLALQQGLLEKAAGPEDEAALDAGLSDRKALLDEAKPAEAGRLKAAYERAEAARRALAPVPAARLRELAKRARDLAEAMDFTFLYNPTRNLFAIGYHVPRGSLDHAHYDLLASEACLTSFLMVARGEAPRRHWFQLGRLFIRVAGHSGLMSWGGTMFEYLMPRLFLPVPAGTLLDAAWHAAVARQIEYGRQTGTAWGVSESAYNLTDAAGNYQYQAFGVPGLGLKRGLGRDLVVAPYACVMAAPLVPHEAMRNLRRLSAEGAEGEHGMYEAIDHTPQRLPPGQKRHIIRSYMAHHQGMSLLALAAALQGFRMAARLGREPAVRAVDLLLQERVPLDASVVPQREPATGGPPQEPDLDSVSRRLTTPTPREPRPHLLSNGRYSLMLTSSGSGYSRWGDLDVSRWRADPTTDDCGQFVYLRDLDSEETWSATHQPLAAPAEQYEVIYSVDKVEFRRSRAGMVTLTEVTVTPEYDAEVRRVTLTNLSDTPRHVELTSYVEVVLATAAADQAHPAFHKLFLQTERLEGLPALLCRRRPRDDGQEVPYAVHVLAGGQGVSWETDRARFLGRRGTAADPAALRQPLSGTVGPVLDPVFALRCRLRVPPGGRASVCFTTGVAATREKAEGLAAAFASLGAADRAFELAWAHSRVELKHLNLTLREAQLFQRLAGFVLFPTATLRAPAGVLTSNHQGQSGLWRHGISGDLPIVVVRVPEGRESLDRVGRVLTAHSYWTGRGLKVDLVLLNEAPTSYHDALNDGIMALIRSGETRDKLNRPAGVFVRKADQFSPDDMNLLLAWARVVFWADRSPLEQVLGLSAPPPRLPPPLKPSAAPAAPSEVAAVPEGLRFFNGTGGFSADGREYVLAPGATGLPPMPWVNVIANPNFGTLVSDSGSGYTWAVNSQLNRLTPWHNDPVCDPPGEVLYLRDEETGQAWTASPLPAGLSGVVVRHGAGYTVFEQAHAGVAQRLTVLVAPDDPVKLSVLRLTNTGPRPRRLSVTFYAEWVLGTTRTATAMHVTTQYDAASGAVFAVNPANSVIAPALSFAALSPRAGSWTGDRVEFIGRDGRLGAPAGLRRVSLSGRVGPALDPCAALQTAFELAPGETRVVVALLGQTADPEAARRLVERYRDPDRAEAALAEVTRRWDDLLGAVQVQTPDEALDLLMNRWLPYQVLGCRLWGRTGLYQSGGAYGFRDQLQDVMALLHAAPGLAREQILRAAGRQFKEGDVQHWWHPPGGAGVRARFSDDFLWLVFVTCRYVEATGDEAILDESVPFLDSPPLGDDQHEVYNQPRVSDEAGPLYDHCVRALQHGWKLGEHGLPLMGIGDWNDGMNRVGVGGKGESVWVAWFQCVCLERFASVAQRRGDAATADLFRERAAQLRQAGEAAWDGGWYRRAYFDDGTPLGSRGNDECQIDSIAQSWAVLAGADAQRCRTALEAAVERLVRTDGKLVLLFDPPFDDGPLRPGYIKGYVPGTRENGGQYTHAAVWLLQAAARLGRADHVGVLVDLLVPGRHAESAEGVGRYRVEPYVVAADVYGRPPHVGRGGWTWYTGSAGWLYQVVLGDVLGVRREGDRLTFAPCVPPGWSGHRVTLRHGGSRYEVTFEGSGRVTSVEGDAVLRDDGATHRIVVHARDEEPIGNK